MVNNINVEELKQKFMLSKKFIDPSFATTMVFYLINKLEKEGSTFGAFGSLISENNESCVNFENNFKSAFNSRISTNKIIPCSLGQDKHNIGLLINYQSKEIKYHNSFGTPINEILENIISKNIPSDWVINSVLQQNQFDACSCHVIGNVNAYNMYKDAAGKSDEKIQGNTDQLKEYFWDLLKDNYVRSYSGYYDGEAVPDIKKKFKITGEEKPTNQKCENKIPPENLVDAKKKFQIKGYSEDSPIKKFEITGEKMLKKKFEIKGNGK